MRENGQAAYAYFMSHVPGIGQKTADKLLAEYGTPENAYGAGEEELMILLGEKRAKAWQALKKDWDVEAQYESLKEKGIRFLYREDQDYPQRLLYIPDPPLGLYVKGAVPSDGKKCVAVVGARRCSAYGRHVAEELGSTLAQAGVQVVSGMATGIDGICQRAVVDNGGETFGVLGCGADICYPACNQQLYQDMQEKGGVISAYLPGTKPRPELFPPRNRIISGLADAVVVVEARQKSGTLITVDMALEQGREIYCVPGRITDRLSDGCNKLIGQGAELLLSPDDLLEKLGKPDKDAGTGTDTAEETEDSGLAALTEQERLMWKLLDYDPVSAEQLFMQFAAENGVGNVTPGQVMALLWDLVLKGKAENVSGCYYVKK